MPSFLRPLVMAVVLAVTPALADDITDAIGRAQEAYASGDLSSSRQALGEASHFLDQMIVEKLATFLPENVSGWSFDTSSDSSSAGSMLGAGNQVTRNYTSGDDKTITLQITADSPVIAQMAAIYTNPQLAGAMGKLVTIGTHRGLRDSSGNITVLVNNRFMIHTSGESTDEEKIALIKAIDFKAMEKI